MSYLDGFEDKPVGLGFNGNEAGVVRNCVVKVERKGSGEKETAPEYKMLGWDEKQVANVDNIDGDKIYPVNKGYFYKDKFNSDKAEQFAVNELKHLLKTFDHPFKKNDKGILVPDIDVEIEKNFKGYNDVLDYTMKFVATKIKEGNNKFDLVVDYGNPGYEKSFLQLNGYPWYIGKLGSDIKNSNKAIMKRPEAESKEGNNTESEGSDSPWVANE